MHLPFGAEVQCAGGVAVDAHLAFDVAALHVVRFTQFALLIDADLGNDENGNALGAGGIAFDPGQDRVNDVLGQVMVAGGNEAFGTGDGVSAVGVLFGCGLEDTHVGTRARLGQAHGAGPYAGVHLLQNDIAQGVLEEIFHQTRCAVGQTGIHEKGLVGAARNILATAAPIINGKA